MQDGRQSQAFLDAALDRKIVPAGKIRRIEQHAGGDIHRAGGSQTGGGNVRDGETGLLESLLSRAADVFDSRLRATSGLGWHAHARQGSPLVVDHARFDVGPPDIDAEKERRRSAIRDSLGAGHGSNGLETKNGKPGRHVSGV